MDLVFVVEHERQRPVDALFDRGQAAVTPDVLRVLLAVHKQLEITEVDREGSGSALLHAIG